MEKLVIVDSMVEDFIRFLRLEEKSKNTIEKYTRDIKGNTAYIEKISDSKEKHPTNKPSVIEISCF